MPGRKSCQRSLQRQRTAARAARQEAAAAQHAGPSRGSPRTGNTASGGGSGPDPAAGAPLTSSSAGLDDVPTLEEILEVDPGLLACLGLGPDGSSSAAPGGAAPASRPRSSTPALPSAAGPGDQQGAGALDQMLHTNPGDDELMASYTGPRWACWAGLGWAGPPIPCCFVQRAPRRFARF